MVAIPGRYHWTNMEQQHIHYPADSIHNGAEAVRKALDGLEDPSEVADMAINVEYNKETDGSWDVQIEYVKQ